MLSTTQLPEGAITIIPSKKLQLHIQYRNTDLFKNVLNMGITLRNKVHNNIQESDK